MALNTNKDTRRYYSIKEVSEIIGVPPSMLRFWEKQIPQLKPQTTSNNVRQYSPKNVEDLKVVYNLVKVRGFKLEAARRMLLAKRGAVEEKARTLELLIKVRNDLQSIKNQLDALE